MAVAKNTAERLTELLNQKDEKIAELRDRAEVAEQRLESSAAAWSMPRLIEDERPTLPLPRLEMVWTKDPELGWARHVVECRLVVQHLVEGIMVIPLGRTKIESGSGRDPFADGESIERKLPYRDGAHAMHDAAHFAMPFYAICPDGPVDLTGRFERQAALGLEHRREGV